MVRCVHASPNRGRNLIELQVCFGCCHLIINGEYMWELKSFFSFPFFSLYMRSFTLLPFYHNTFEFVSPFVSSNLLFFWSRLLKEQKVFFSLKVCCLLCIRSSTNQVFAHVLLPEKSFLLTLRACARVRVLLHQSTQSRFCIVIHFYAALFIPPPPTPPSHLNQGSAVLVPLHIANECISMQILKKKKKGREFEYFA